MAAMKQLEPWSWQERKADQLGHARERCWQLSLLDRVNLFGPIIGPTEAGLMGSSLRLEKMGL